MDLHIKLARKAIEGYLNNGKVVGTPNDLPPEFFEKKQGVFVSLHENGELRGCVGTYFPVHKNLAEEIIRNAIAASTQDPRFEPVSPREINGLEIEVSVLDEPKIVKSIEELDPKKYGVIAKCADGRCGLLLPDLEGVSTAHRQFSLACEKGGICRGRDNDIEMYRFTVTKHKSRNN